MDTRGKEARNMGGPATVPITRGGLLCSNMSCKVSCPLYKIDTEILKRLNKLLTMLDEWGHNQSCMFYPCVPQGHRLLTIRLNFATPSLQVYCQLNSTPLSVGLSKQCIPAVIVPLGLSAHISSSVQQHLNFRAFCVWSNAASAFTLCTPHKDLIMRFPWLHCCGFDLDDAAIRSPAVSRAHW
jgi:hypothetical protein